MGGPPTAPASEWALGRACAAKGTRRGPPRGSSGATGQDGGRAAVWAAIGWASWGQAGASMAHEHGPLHAALRATATPTCNGAGSRGADGGGGVAWLGRRASAGVGGAGRLAWLGRHGCTHPAGRPRNPGPCRAAAFKRGGLLGKGQGRVARGPADTVTPALIPGAHGPSAIWRGAGG